MYKLILALSIIALVSFGVALADDMDGDRVVRDEHVARAAGNGDQGAAENPSHARPSRDDDKNIPESEHGQDLLQMRADLEGRSMPDSLELDSLGLYFGLGEHFVSLADSLISERAGDYEATGGAPMYSRLSDGPLSDLHATRDDSRTASHEHSQEAGGDGGNNAAEDQGLNRRGADYDYFWD
jgi:hypothetical protein